MMVISLLLACWVSVAAQELPQQMPHELIAEDLEPSHRRKLAKADQDVVQWIATGKWKVSNNGRQANLPAVSGGHGFIYANQPKSSNKWYVELVVNSVSNYKNNGGHFGVGLKCVANC